LRGPNAKNFKNYATGYKAAEAFSKELKLAPKQSTEIEIPVSAAPNFGLTFLADSLVSATLFDDKDRIIGKNLANTDAAKTVFRSIFASKPVTGGIWKLKLENTSKSENVVLISTWAKVSGALSDLTAANPASDTKSKNRFTFE